MNTQEILKLSKELNDAQSVRDELIEAKDIREHPTDKPPQIILTINDRHFPLSGVEVGLILDKAIGLQNDTINSIRQRIQKELFPTIERPRI